MGRTRCFLAIELDPAVKSRVVGLQTELRRSYPDLKWVGAENLHVTLLFLGEVDDREIVKVCRVAQEAAAGLAPFSMSIEQLGCFPHPRRPRTLWVGVREGRTELIALYEALALPLSELGYRREDRPYSPHITLGRAKTSGPTYDLQSTLEKHHSWEAGAIQVNEVLVMSSELTREGPLYTVLGRAELGD